MSDEKTDFAKHLAAAMRAKGWGTRPVDLEKRFNSRYSGRSVTFQTVSAWLGGRSMPRPEKLQALADLLGVEPQALVYGGPKGGNRVRDPALAWPGSISEPDRQALVTYLELPVPQRKLVRELIGALQDSAKSGSR